MQEERLVILRMLAEGKITAEEADSLLAALASKPAAKVEPAGRHCPEGVGALAGRIASWGAEFGTRVAEEICEGRVPILGWIADCFDGRETVTERAGEFESEEVKVECACEVGSLLLRGGEGTGYHLTVRQRFGRSDGPGISAAGDRLTVRGNGIVRLELTLPHDHCYELRLRSSAGRIELDGLAFTRGVLSIEAGGIRLAGVSGGDLAAETSAGSIEAVAISARDFRGETDCGRIHLELAPQTSGRYRLTTDIGAISVLLPLREGIGYRLGARTGVGSIRCAPCFAVGDDDRSIGHRSLRAATPGFAAAERQLEIEARTDCGSIEIDARQG